MTPGKEQPLEAVLQALGRCGLDFGLLRSNTGLRAAVRPESSGEIMRRRTPDIITFKVDESLREAMKGIPNRSEFIRNAVLNALDSGCPLCRGTGTLTPHQRTHWAKFAADHALKECDDCHEFHLVCAKSPSGQRHPRRERQHRP